MSYRNTVLQNAYHPLRFAKKIGRSLTLVHKNSLRILNYHDVPAEDLDRFAAQLRWLSKSYSFVTPKQFSAMLLGSEEIKGHNLMISFDDGFSSNRAVAEEVLDGMGISAIFFIVSDFVGINNNQEAREFISENIYYALKTEALPDNWGNMGWKDLEFLLDKGHTIGAHTMTHKKLSSLTTEEDLKKEIIESADVLGKRLGTEVEHFAFPFGNMESFSEQALSVAKQRFKFVHSGLRGDNATGATPYTIRRDAAALQHPVNNKYSVYNNALVGAFLEGIADRYYATSRNQLDVWNNHTKSM